MPEGWKGGYSGERHPMFAKKTAAGDAPPEKKEKGKEKIEVKIEEKPAKGKGKEDKGKEKDKDDKASAKGGKAKREPEMVMPVKGKKGQEPEPPAKGKKVDAVPLPGKGGKLKKAEEPPEPEIIPPTASQLAVEEAEYRATTRKQNLCRKRWPSITKVKVNTKPWAPPGPPEKPPKVMIEIPPVETRPWIPPWRRRRPPRPKLPRMDPEQITQPIPYEGSKLQKVWHGFHQVDSNKMMLQGTVACNSKRYMGNLSGAQSGCIALVCRALLHDKTAAQLARHDVDDVIDAGDRFYKQCTKAMKCYKGKPSLELHQLLPNLYFRDNRYTLNWTEVDKGVLCKHPDNLEAGPDLLALMEKRTGSTYMMILTVGKDQHFLIWGHPPEAGAGSSCKTVCYIFDPFMLDQFGTYDPTSGAAAFLRYAGVHSFVVDFLGNHCDMDQAKRMQPKPPVTLTNVEVAHKEAVWRWPGYELELKVLKPHCRSEWEAFAINRMTDEKMYKRKWALASMSAESLAMSRKSSRKKFSDFFAKIPKEPPPPQPPVPAEKPPPGITTEQLLQHRGENFFLYCPRADAHIFGRDDMIPLSKSETQLHSPFEMAAKSFPSQFVTLPVSRKEDPTSFLGEDDSPTSYGTKMILRGTRHFASYRYQLFKSFTGVACCVAALAMLRRHRARAWNEDTLDETCDVGWNLFRESLSERRGPIRRLVLGELAQTFSMRDKKYKHKERGIAVWGRLNSTSAKVFDLCRGLEAFFKESDSGILQIPGEFETAIWYEGGMWYLYHPWPADRFGNRVGLQGGGKACLLAFTEVQDLCEHFIDNTRDLKRKPFSISDVNVWELGVRPDPVNNMKPLGPDRWIVRGSFHEGDERFPEEHRNRQATPTSIAAIAMASLIDPAEWTEADIDEILLRGDVLYEKTMETLDKMGINLETAGKPGEENEGEEEEAGPGVTGTLAAADVLPRFNISEYDSIETDIQDSAFTGVLVPEAGSGLKSLQDSLAALFVHNQAGVVTCRGGSVAVWSHGDHYYFFDPHGCDENGLPSTEPLSGACLIRLNTNAKELAEVILGNLAPGTDDSFNISPVEVIPAKINPETGAPEIKPEGKAFEWLNKNTATILMGPRGENSARGKVAKKCSVPKEDLAGRTLALPSAAAFCAASAAVQPPGMHQDHMYNFIECGGEYYLKHVKTTGRRELGAEDLGGPWEMGANTFALELAPPARLPLRLPDTPAEGGGEEEEVPGGLGEGEHAPTEQLKEMKELLFKMWYDTTKPTSVSLLLGDYHQLGVWMAAGGKLVVFDPAPTLAKGLLTPHRIAKGDELRKQRIKDERVGEAEEEDEEMGEGGEEAEPEVEQFVPPESCPALMVFASPGEFIDKLVAKGGLDKKQALAPYWLYPVTVTNELTSDLKEKRAPGKTGEEEAAEDEEESLVEPLSDAALGKHFVRRSRTVASVRGSVAQDEAYFAAHPNRDNQDAAMSVMGIVVHHIEPYQYWKPALIDAILKYGDRLYTLSLPNAKNPPRLAAAECIKEFHVTNFNVKVEVEGDVVTGDFKAGDTGSLLNLKRGLKKFFDSGEKFAVICAKNYCGAVWQAADEKAWVYWDPHPVGPRGKLSPASAAGVVLFSALDELADTFRTNLFNLCRPGPNKYTISSVKASWEFSSCPQPVQPPGVSPPDEGYEFKVLTAFVEVGKGRTLLRGSRPLDLPKFARDACLASAPTAIVAAVMSQIRKPSLWTRNTIDEIMHYGCLLFSKSIANLGYEFRPGEDVLVPLQVVKKFVLGVNFVRYDLESLYTGTLEQKEAPGMTAKAALERFFELYNVGVLWAAPHAVAVWRCEGAPRYYMMEPHACGPTGLRTDADEDGAACVQTFTSPKLMAFTYLQNVCPVERYRRHFVMYGLKTNIVPVAPVHGVDPPLVRRVPGLPKGTWVVPATSKVDVYGNLRRAEELQRVHPPGDDTWRDAARAVEQRERSEGQFGGQRNSNGWLVLADGSQYLSAGHSLACRRYPPASRGNQALACSVMAVAMSAVEQVCRWCSATLDQVLDSGDQLYQDSYLHYRPTNTPILSIQQILRKFFTPGNCVCRVVVYKPRQSGMLNTDLLEKLKEFFREERRGVLVAFGGEFAVALFKTPRGYYMFDAADRDRCGRAVPPALVGRARACFSQYPTVQSLAEKLAENIRPPTKPRPIVAEDGADAAELKSKSSIKKVTSASASQVRFASGGADGQGGDDFYIYGMGVSSLRRLNQHEK